MKRSFKGQTSPIDGDLLVCLEHAPRNLGIGLGKVAFLFRRQLDRRLLDPGERQQHAGNFVLHFVGQGGDGGDGLFE